MVMVVPPLQAVTELRGKNKVQDQDPEGKYEALAKYARDLTQVGGQQAGDQSRSGSTTAMSMDLS